MGDLGLALRQHRAAILHRRWQAHVLVEDANNVTAIKHHMHPLLKALGSDVHLGVLMGTTSGGDGQPSLRGLHPMLIDGAVKAFGQRDTLRYEFPEIIGPKEALAEARESI